MAAKDKKDDDVTPELVAVRLRFGGGGLKRGAVLNVSPAEAARLVDNGSAVPVA